MSHQDDPLDDAPGEEPSSARLAVLAAIWSMPGLALALGHAWLLPQLSLSKTSWRVLVTAVPLLLLLIFFQLFWNRLVLSSSPSSFLRRFSEIDIGRIHSRLPVPILLFLTGPKTLLSEMLFRGTVMPACLWGLKQMFGSSASSFPDTEALACAGQAAFYMLSHQIRSKKDMVYSLNLLIDRGCYGYLALASHSLWIPWLMHWAWDGGRVLLFVSHHSLIL